MLRKFGQTIRGLMEGRHEAHYTPTPIAQPSRSRQHVGFSQLLPYIAWIEAQRLFVLEGDEPGVTEGLGFAIEMWPQTGASEEVTNLLMTIFNQLPTGTCIQWSLLASPLIENHLDSYVACRPDPANAENQEEVERRILYRSLAQRQARHFADGAHVSLVSHQPYLLRDFRLVMSVVIPSSTFDDPALLKQIVFTREMIVTTLKTYHQFMREWVPEDLINWCAVLLNLQDTFAKRDAPWINYDGDRPIKEQIVHPNTVIRAHEDGLFFGLPQRGDEFVAKCMTVRSYPKAYSLHAMGNLIGDYLQPTIAYNCPFLIACGIEIQDYQKTREITQIKSARATQKADSRMARFLPDLVKQKDDWDIAQNAFSEGHGTVRMYHQIVLFDRPDQIAKSAQSAQSVFRKAGFELVEDTYMQLQAFLSALPLSLTPSLAKDISTAQRMVTKTAVNAVNLAPLVGEWHGIGDTIVPLAGRRGQIMFIDLFGNVTGNYNAVVCGKSGSGKSVLLNLLTLSYLGIGARVWIIDIGRSFAKLCDQVGGQYIEMSKAADIRLNPFSMVINIDEDIEMLTALFCHMCSPSATLTDHLKSILKAHLTDIWYTHGRAATVDHVQYSLVNNCEMGGPNPLQNDPVWLEKVRNMPYEERRNYCDPRVRDLGMSLFPYTSVGNFGKYFTGEANIDFDNALVVLELEELAQITELRTIIMFLVMYKITQAMYLMPRDQPKLCIIDEAWQLLAGGASGDFVESGYRRARKYGGAFLTATQSMQDYDISVASKAALTNADWIFLLGQKPESVQALIEQKKILVDDYMQKLLLSVHTEQGRFSEVFISAGDMGKGIGRILLDPYSLLMASSKAEDFEAVKRYREVGYSLPQALEAVLADRGYPGYEHPRERIAA
jgi:conjugal transfer ATP-binding protein TraC